MTVTPQWTDRLMRVLGDELRAARKARGWTRNDLLRHLGVDVSTQTIATWELGTRKITVARLLEYCAAIDVPPMVILTHTYERVFDEMHASVGSWTIDLTAAAGLATDELTPLARWAAVRLREGARTTARFDREAVTHLAVLCRMDPRDLARRLPRPVPRERG